MESVESPLQRAVEKILREHGRECALRFLKNKIGKDRKNAEAHFLMGVVRADKDQHHAAVVSIDKALTLSPAESHYGLVKSMFEQPTSSIVISDRQPPKQAAHHATA